MNLTSTTYDYITIAFSVLCLLVPCYDIIDNTSRRGIKRITKLGWMLIIVSFLFGGTSALKINAANSEKKVEGDKADSTRIADKVEIKNDVDTALKKYGLVIKTDTKSNTLKIVDTVRINEFVNPVMDIATEGTKVVGKVPDSLFVQFASKVINSGIAFKVRETIIAFRRYNLTFKKVGESDSENNDRKGYGKQGVYFSNLFYLPKKPINDTLFFLYKAKYSNKEINGKDQPVLREIFTLLMVPYVKSIDQLKLEPVVFTSDYKDCKDFLVKNKYW